MIFKPSTKSICLRFLFGLSITGFLIYGILYNVKFDQLKSMLVSWDLNSLCLALLFALIGILIRGVRWALIVNQMGKAHYALAIHTAHAGIMLNAIMPLRIGDFYKVMFIGRTGKFTYNKALIALGFERLLDLLILYSFYLITLLMMGMPNSVPVNLFGQNIPKTFISNSFNSIAIIIMIIAFILLFLQSRFVKKFLISAYFSSKGLIHKSLFKLYMFQKSFIGAVRLVRSPFQLSFICILTLSLWLLFALSVYFVSFGVEDVHLDFIHIIFITSVALLSVQLPSVPGGWGLFEMGGVLAIVSYSNLDVSIAFSVIFIAHLCQYIPSIIIGLYSQLILLISSPLENKL
tara:strand:- start:903 stop:1946 length:1044 start_codon:yes stop_codon:yes gene_type:complete